MVAPDGTPANTWQLGRLDGFFVRGGVYVAAPHGTYLASDRHGRDLYFLRQGSPWALGCEFAAVRAVAIVYWSNKASRAHKPFEHTFGEGGGPRPRLEVDPEGLAVLRRRGSRYRVTWRGIED